MNQKPLQEKTVEELLEALQQTNTTIRKALGLCDNLIKELKRRQLPQKAISSEIAQHGDASLVEELGLSERTRKCLLSQMILTIEQLENSSRVELLKIPNLGRSQLKEIEARLAKLGRRLTSP